MKIKQKSRSWGKDLSAKALRAEHQYNINPTTETQHVWLQSQQSYASLSLKEAEHKRFFLQQPYLEEGENTWNLLATVVMAQKQLAYVTELQKTATSVVHTTLDNSLESCDFFKGL